VGAADEFRDGALVSVVGAGETVGAIGAGDVDPGGSEGAWDRPVFGAPVSVEGISEGDGNELG